MKSNVQSISYKTSLVLGILFLISGIAHVTVALLDSVDNRPLTGFPSDELSAALIFIPAVLLFLYIITRIYKEFNSVGRTVLAVIVVVLTPVLWYLILYLIANNGVAAAVFAYGSLGICALAPVILTVVGFVKKTGWMTLISTACPGWVYVLGVLFCCAMANDIQILSYSALLLIPLMLFATADLILQYYLKATNAPAVQMA